jgi:hypothetical protein
MFPFHIHRSGVSQAGSKQRLFRSAFLLGSPFNLKISVSFQRATRHYISENGTLHNHLCENLKRHLLLFFCTILIASREKYNMEINIFVVKPLTEMSVKDSQPLAVKK